MAATATTRNSAQTARRTPTRRTSTRRAAGSSGRRRGNTPIAGFVPVAAVGGAVGGLADSGLFVWLTRSRLWIGLLGTLLVGIVGLNVMALSFSASSSSAGQAADSLRRQNSAIRAEIASRLTNAKIQAVAARLGLVMPGAGSIGYLKTSPDDARVAAGRLRDGELTFADAGAPAAPVATETTAPVTTAAVPTAPVAPVAATTPDPAVATTDPAAAPAAATTPPVAAATTSGGGGVSVP